MQQGGSKQCAQAAKTSEDVVGHQSDIVGRQIPVNDIRMKHEYTWYGVQVTNSEVKLPRLENVP